MRRVSVGLAILSLAAALATAACGANESAAPAAAAAAAPASPVAKPTGTLAQVMRGIYFPNANLLFDVQQRDPGAPPGAASEGPRGSVTEQFSSIYSGWQVQENAAIALIESIDLLTVPGRLCQNGKPVPIDQPTFQKAAEGMRAAAHVALDAARAKNLEKAIAATDTVAEACGNCHEPYRDKGEADGPERCTP
jgi:hypothetical protein